MIRRDGDDDKTDPNAPTTYHALAQAGMELEGGGRFGAQPKVIGTSANAGAAYPRSSVPNADVGEERELGDDFASGACGHPCRD